MILIPPGHFYSPRLLSETLTDKKSGQACRYPSKNEGSTLIDGCSGIGLHAHGEACGARGKTMFRLVVILGSSTVPIHFSAK